MDSDHRQRQHQNPNPNQTQISTLKSKTLMFYLLPLSILLLAITFNFYIRTNHLIIPLPKSISHSKPSISSPSDCILWMAPFLSGGGYCSEAWSYIVALNDRNKDSSNSFNFRLCIEQHGDLESWNFWEGLPPEVRSLAVKLHQTECRMNETVVVCHSEPGAWYPPLYETYPCPPNVAGYRNFRAVIGRTMFETDRVNVEHVERCNRMDYVWVPTDFHVDTFLRSGVDSSKIVKVVQSVDVDFFDPLKYDALDLAAIGKLVLGEPNEGLRSSGKEFVFVSVFKWESRKGWDVLLKAYLEEFCGTDGVVLYMLTNPFHTKRDFKNKIIEFVKRSGLKKLCDSWAPVYVIDTHIAQTELPRMYKAVDSFVLPSRGEGWGRPLVEAMSMALPVIATNWSGPTEYLTEENSYPLTVDEMSEVKEGPFKGHLWAEPSVEKLRLLMRRVMTDVEEAKSRGRQAREDMKKRFSPQIVANIVAEQIKVAFDRRT